MIRECLNRSFETDARHLVFEARSSDEQGGIEHIVVGRTL